MKIFAISAARIPSDTANSIQVMKACQGMAQLGHEVTLLTLADGSPAMEKQDLWRHYGLKTDFEVNRLPSASRRMFTWQAVRQAKRAGAELLYTWPPQSAAFGRAAGLPVILELHDLPTGRGGPLWLKVFLRGSRRKRLVLITRALQHALERDLHLDLGGQDVRILPNGVDLERYADLPDPQTARKRLGLPESLTVACSGHLYAGRGADLFLGLAEGEPGVQFLWAGGRPQDVQDWQGRARERGLENVRFTGFIPNETLALTQAAAEILLMPYGRVIAVSTGVGRSAEVASPMKMFEYMAAGRAILTSDLPVLREVLDESTAVFCTAEDLAAWKAALRTLLQDGARRDALGARARRAADGYTWIERARQALAGFEVQR